MVRRRDLLIALEMITGGDQAPLPESLRATALAVREKARPWTMGEGIQGVGIAEKTTDSTMREEVVIKVYVEKKKIRSKVSNPVPATLRIPGVEEPVRTDVEEIGLVEKETNTGAFDR